MLEGLTPREREILEAPATGKANKEIAKRFWDTRRHGQAPCLRYPAEARCPEPDGSGSLVRGTRVSGMIDLPRKWDCNWLAILIGYSLSAPGAVPRVAGTHESTRICGHGHIGEPRLRSTLEGLNMLSVIAMQGSASRLRRPVSAGLVVMCVLASVASASTALALRLLDGSGTTLWDWAVPGDYTYSGLYPSGQLNDGVWFSHSEDTNADDEGQTQGLEVNVFEDNDGSSGESFPIYWERMWIVDSTDSNNSKEYVPLQGTPISSDWTVDAFRWYHYTSDEPAYVQNQITSETFPPVEGLDVFSWRH